jgi:hypothetical protein
MTSQDRHTDTGQLFSDEPQSAPQHTTPRHGDPRLDEAPMDEARMDEARLDDARHDDARHDDARHDDARHDDARANDLRSHGTVQPDRVQPDRVQSDRVQSDRVQSDRVQSDRVQPGPADPGEAGGGLPQPAADPQGGDRYDGAAPAGHTVDVGAGTTPAAAGHEDGAREPLVPTDRAQSYGSRWDTVKGTFVDEPREAVAQADALVGELLDELQNGFREQRRRIEHGLDADQTSTEDLRVALRRYRSFFDRLLSI